MTRDGTWVDLSQPVFGGMPMPGPHGEVSVWVDQLQPKPGGPLVSITHLGAATHVGTHVDAQRHFIEGGRTIDEYDITKFVGEGVVLDVRSRTPRAIDERILEAQGALVRPDDIVLLFSGWAERFRDRSYFDHPYLTAGAAMWLLDRSIKMVGTDTMTPDMAEPQRPAGFDWPVHRLLLGQDVLIIENLGPGLERLVGRRIEVVATPVRIEGADGAPVVALARAVSD